MNMKNRVLTQLLSKEGQAEVLRRSAKRLKNMEREKIDKRKDSV